MNIDDITIKQFNELFAIFKNDSIEDNSHWETGKPYFIRTVTFAYNGILEKVTDKELVFSKCAWIADTGRFADAMEDSSKFDEVEPYPPTAKVIVGRGSIIDAVVISKIQSSQK